jgi:hypothetical protein
MSEVKPIDQKESLKQDLRQFLTVTRRNHQMRVSETELNARLEREILLVIVGTEEYMKTEEVLPRLEDIKDNLRAVKGNPFDMDLSGGADAKVQKDMLRVCRNTLQYEGAKHEIVCKEINKNAIVYFDITTARAIVDTEKDPKKKTILAERMSKVLRLKTREGYERKL